MVSPLFKDCVFCFGGSWWACLPCNGSPAGPTDIYRSASHIHHSQLYSNAALLQARALCQTFKTKNHRYLKAWTHNNINYDDRDSSNSITQGADPLTPPPLLRVVKTGKNHLNEEITHVLPTGIGGRFSQTISNLGHAALLRRCELPINESAEQTRGAL